MNSQGRGEELIVLYDVISPNYEPILYIHGVNIQTDCDCENMFIFFCCESRSDFDNLETELGNYNTELMFFLLFVGVC